MRCLLLFPSTRVLCGSCDTTWMRQLDAPAGCASCKACRHMPLPPRGPAPTSIGTTHALHAWMHRSCCPDRAILQGLHLLHSFTAVCDLANMAKCGQAPPRSTRWPGAALLRLALSGSITPRCQRRVGVAGCGAWRFAVEVWGTAVGPAGEGGGGAAAGARGRVPRTSPLRAAGGVRRHRHPAHRHGAALSHRLPADASPVAHVLHFSQGFPQPCSKRILMTKTAAHATA